MPPGWGEFLSRGGKPIPYPPSASSPPSRISDEIVPGLFLGGADVCRQLHPGSAVRLAGRQRSLARSRGRRRLPSATTLVSQRLDLGERVLVHCRAGRQRSAAVVAAVLMRRLGLGVEEAMAAVRARQQAAFFPAANFSGALAAFDRMLADERTNATLL